MSEAVRIERKFSKVPNSDVMGLRPGASLLRGVTSMTLLFTVAAVAHNLRP